ncbi:hypothetical protein A0H81_14386 [Grifola frondosa]|uniref:Transposase family Tnp2 protein n=1 Tax=Grifola frondosa TaxID=5627 RepID=A0A1C7LLC8_GRIFR|nr:hypothetical protein A0H81_14386 [Grifola frondosa]
MPDTDEPMLTSDEASDIHEMDNTDTQSSLLAMETTATTPTEAADPDTSIQTALIEDVVHEAWHGRLRHHVYVEDCPSDEASNAESDEESDWASESPSSEDEGLSAWDWMGADFESRAMAIDKKLDEYDKSTLRAFALKVDSHMSTKTFAKLSYYTQHSMAAKMRYRAKEHVHDLNTMTDIFDSNIYHSKLGKHVVIHGKKLGHTFLGDPRDVALGLSTDGFAPFKHRKSTSWPIILYNYNLPPEIHFHKENIIPLGEVPGPKKPIDFDSFLWPIVEELLHLEVGVRAWDAHTTAHFILCAFLIIVAGDIPAISMVMHMKGHNSFLPCRMCNIHGVRTPDNPCSPYYVPLDRQKHPDLEAPHFMILPISLYKRITRFSCKPTRSCCAVLPIITHIPTSFPYDFMHLIWENLLKNLIALWTGEFKGLDEGAEEYQLYPDIWTAIGTATATTGDTIPFAFGPRTPNIDTDSPVVLARWFTRPKYYEHFVALIKLLHICLLFDITQEQIQEVRKGFIKWVKDYEIADSIESSGPVWASWAFPMERYCSSLQPAIKSHRFPYASIDHYILDAVRLQHIKLIYNMTEELALRLLHAPALLFSTHEYPTFGALATQFDVPGPMVHRCLPSEVTLWGKVLIFDDGDTVHASASTHARGDSRDVTYVRYEVLVDKNARYPRCPVILQKHTMYGQLQYLYTLKFKPSQQLHLTEPTTVILAAI